MSAAEALPYHGDDPAELLFAAGLIQQARGRLALLNDGLLDARGDLTRSWKGGSADIGSAEVATAITATALGVGRLDSARSALLTCSDELKEIRTVIDAYRLEWEWNESQISLLRRSAAGPAGFSTDPVEQRRIEDIARYQGNQATLVLDWRRQVQLADEATLACVGRLQGCMQGAEFASGAGSARASLGNALGTDLLALDDSLVSRLVSGDSSSWNQLSAIDQRFLLELAGASGFPPTEVSPQSVNRAWAGLDPMAQRALIYTQPAALGALDGVPVVARDQANRMLVPALAEQLRGELAALGPRPVTDGQPRYNDPTVDEQFAWDLRHEQLTGELGGVNAIVDRLDDAEPAPVYLMGLDLAKRGQAIIAIGNPDTAADVATFVPGSGSDLAGINGNIARSVAMFDSAQVAGSGSTAVITWLGYNPPPGVLDAAYDSYADDGAPALDRFADGLRATHLGEPSHNSIVAHSYAGLLVAAAASGGNYLAMDDVIIVGGTGMELPSAGSLQLVGVSPDQLGEHVFATMADADPIWFSGSVHSDLPSGSTFGATVFDAGIADGMLSAHSAYWNAGSNALAVMGQVIAAGSITGPR